MKALIFNSGRGIRMGELTYLKPKCMLTLYNGETILERQLRILENCGIEEVVITTGPFREQLIAVTQHFPRIEFTFVDNKEYEITNYIFSMYLATQYMDDDILLLHGDLVFNESIVCKMLGDKRPSLCLFHETKSLPQKDFKGRFKDGMLKEVSVSIFDEDCKAFQPFYKLGKRDIKIWLESVRQMIEEGETKVYAENALNTVLSEIALPGISYAMDYMEEIDDENDYRRVSEEIRILDQKEQMIEKNINLKEAINMYISSDKPLFVVCSKREEVRIRSLLCNEDIIFFHSFSPNPKYEEVLDGVKEWKKNRASVILAVGGGSAIDVAKCIKLCIDTTTEDFMANRFRQKDITLISVPTTAGTGSESTAIAVIYYKGEKHSVAHESALPDIAILDPELLSSLPEYHRKSALMDAYCQAIESFWARAATSESRFYAKRCISLIQRYGGEYLKNGQNAREIMLAANYSGKAIHISRTTAAHAMSYKLTTLYQITHGHAVSLSMLECFKKLCRYAKENTELNDTMQELAECMGVDSYEEAFFRYNEMYNSVCFPQKDILPEDLETLVESVNMERLGNNPVIFSKEDIKEMYRNLMDQR